MDKEKQIAMIHKTGVIAIIRAQSSGNLIEKNFDLLTERAKNMRAEVIKVRKG
jgi:hypothetical protein